MSNLHEHYDKLTNRGREITKVSETQISLKAALDCVPTNWLDPLLTGKDAVIRPPYNCPDIERLLNAIRNRIIDAAEKSL